MTTVNKVNEIQQLRATYPFLNLKQSLTLINLWGTAPCTIAVINKDVVYQDDARFELTCQFIEAVKIGHNYKTAYHETIGILNAQVDIMAAKAAAIHELRSK